MAIQNRKFTTVEEFAQAVQDYFDWADENPVRLTYSRKFKGEAGAKEPTNKEDKNNYAVRPYLLQELAYKIGISSWSDFKRDNAEREGFMDVIKYVENRVAAQQLTGAMVGLYRENIVARLNGIFDNVATVTPPPSTVEKVYEQ